MADQRNKIIWRKKKPCSLRKNIKNKNQDFWSPNFELIFHALDNACNTSHELLNMIQHL